MTGFVVCAACKKPYLEVGEAVVEEGKNPDDPDLVNLCEDCAKRYNEWKRGQIRH